MSNNYAGNPIVLDTFTSDIDLGQILFGDSKALFFIEAIEWQNPSAANDTATIYDGSGTRPIFAATCTTAKQNIQKKFGGTAIQGLKISTGGVSSGTISILLSTSP